MQGQSSGNGLVIEKSMSRKIKGARRIEVTRLREPKFVKCWRIKRPLSKRREGETVEDEPRQWTEFLGEPSIS